MKLLSLKATNVLQYKEIDVDFTKLNKFISLTGKYQSQDETLEELNNGIGKSNFIKIINWMLFNKYDLTEDELINFKEDELFVSLKFIHNDTIAEIVKTKKRGKASKVFLKINDDNNVIVKKKTDIKSYINTLLNTDFDLFNKIYYFKQKSDNIFLNSTNIELKNFIDTLIGIPNLNKIHKELKKISNKINLRINTLETYQKEIERYKSQKQQIKCDIINLQEKNKQIVQDTQFYKKKQNELNTQLEKLKMKYDSLDLEKQSKLKEKNELTIKKTTISSEINILKNKLETIQITQKQNQIKLDNILKSKNIICPLNLECPYTQKDLDKNFMDSLYKELDKNNDIIQNLNKTFAIKINEYRKIKDIDNDALQKCMDLFTDAKNKYFKLNDQIQYYNKLKDNNVIDTLQKKQTILGEINNSITLNQKRINKLDYIKGCKKDIDELIYLFSEKGIRESLRNELLDVIFKMVNEIINKIELKDIKLFYEYSDNVHETLNIKAEVDGRQGLIKSLSVGEQDRIGIMFFIVLNMIINKNKYTIFLDESLISQDKFYSNRIINFLEGLNEIENCISISHSDIDFSENISVLTILNKDGYSYLINV